MFNRERQLAADPLLPRTTGKPMGAFRWVGEKCPDALDWAG